MTSDAINRAITAVGTHCLGAMSLDSQSHAMCQSQAGDRGPARLSLRAIPARQELWIGRPRRTWRLSGDPGEECRDFVDRMRVGGVDAERWTAGRWFALGLPRRALAIRDTPENTAAAQSKRGVKRQTVSLEPVRTFSATRLSQT
jgi:hypothetical protein